MNTVIHSPDPEEDLRHNGEGYPDVTACRAIRHCEKDERRRAMSKMMERGDIWEMETAGGDVMDALILACFRTHAEGIMLTPVAPLEHGVKVRSAAWVWADCSRISHINYKYRLRRVRSLDASEMERVIDGIARAFGLAPLRLIPQEGGTS